MQTLREQEEDTGKKNDNNNNHNNHKIAHPNTMFASDFSTEKKKKLAVYFCVCTYLYYYLFGISIPGALWKWSNATLLDNNTLTLNPLT